MSEYDHEIRQIQNELSDVKSELRYKVDENNFYELERKVHSIESNLDHALNRIRDLEQELIERTLDKLIR